MCWIDKKSSRFLFNVNQLLILILPMFLSGLRLLDFQHITWITLVRTHTTKGKLKTRQKELALDSEILKQGVGYCGTPHSSHCCPDSILNPRLFTQISTITNDVVFEEDGFFSGKPTIRRSHAKFSPCVSCNFSTSSLVRIVMTSYTAFLWVFVQTVSGKRASDTFVKLLEAHSVWFYRWC